MIEELYKPIHFKKLYTLVFTLLGILIINYLVSDPISRMLEIPIFTRGFNDLSSSQKWSAIIIAPIVEEVVFRNHLKINRKSVLTLSLIPIFGVITFYELGNFVVYIGLILAVLLFVFVVKFFHFLNTQIGYRITFFLSSLCFCLMHLNIIGTKWIWSGLFICVISYFPLAMALGYFRVRYGLPIAMLSHALNNFLILILNPIVY